MTALQSMTCKDLGLPTTNTGLLSGKLRRRAARGGCSLRSESISDSEWTQTLRVIDLATPRNHLRRGQSACDRAMTQSPVGVLSTCRDITPMTIATRGRDRTRHFDGHRCSQNERARWR